MMEEVDLADTPLAMRPQLQSHDSTTAIDEDPPDPRIQIELERLNTSTDLINKLEVDLDEARMMFRQTLLESTQRIDTLTKKLGKCVDQARPYYEARIKAKQALTEAQKSAVRYERAVSQHAAAREMVQLAEEGLLTRGCIFDSTWQEMLNHATTKVNDAEREKIESTGEHKEKSNKYHESETRVKFLQKELKRSIAKSSLNARRSLLQLSNIIRMQDLQLLPYFELKAAVNQRLEEQKKHVRELEAAVSSAKANYSQALSNLETISDQIHKTRQNRVDLGIRGVGVGAESPGPPFGAKGEKEIARQKSKCDPLAKAASQEKMQLAPSVPGAAEPLQEKGEGPGVEGHDGSPPKTLPGRPSAGGPLPMPTKGPLSEAPSPSTTGDASEPQATFLSEWQFVAIPGLPPSTNQNLLSIEDRESVVSDSESLTSMEMLSEEAIANLMLEEEITEATHSICSPPPSEEYLAPPGGSKGPLCLPGGPSSRRREGGAGSPEGGAGKEASSSDSGGAEPWEVVGAAPSPPSPQSNPPPPPALDPGEPSRPQSLPVSPLYHKSSSETSSTSTSNSASGGPFSPGYAPLGDTPERGWSGGPQSDGPPSAEEDTR